MCASLNDMPLLQDDDLIGIVDGTESMGKNEDCALLHESCNRREYVCLVGRIEIRGGFIQDEQGRIFGKALARLIRWASPPLGGPRRRSSFHIAVAVW